MSQRQKEGTAAPQKGAVVPTRKTRFQRVPKQKNLRVINLGLCCGRSYGPHPRDSCAGCITCHHGSDPFGDGSSGTYNDLFHEFEHREGTRGDHKREVEAKYLAKGMKIVEWRDGNCDGINIVVEDL